MRSDFIGDCAQFPDLTQIINKSHYLIPQMVRDQQKLAIEGPIAVGGGKITRRLTQQLLNDVGNNPDQLPILQHALMRTWDYWIQNREEGEPMDLRHYIAIGKLDEALSQHANETFSELDKNEREICEIIFKTLTEKGRENYGIRRAAKISDLSAIAGVSEEEIIGIVEKFRKPGRSLLMPPANVPLRSNTIIEISHESLMRIWDRLKNWVDEEFESAQMYRRLSDAAAMYQVGRTGLWRPPDLQLALNWQKKQQPTRAWAQRYNPVFERAMLFLDTSKTAFENEQRSKELLQRNMLKRARNVAFFLGFATIVSIIFFIFALIQKIDADEKALEAQRNAELAGRQRELALMNSIESSMGQIRANQQANLALQRQKEAEEARRIAEEQRQLARMEQKRAEEQEKRAISEANRAETQRLAAIEASERAEVARNNAFRLRMLSIAQGMAVKSLQIQDAQLEGLVSQQAYIFNLRHEGERHDRYIYNGLYNALKSLSFKESDSVYSMYNHEGNVRGLAFSNDGKTLYSTGTDGKLLKWNFEPENYKSELYYQNEARNRLVKTTKDGKWLILTSDLKGVQCYELGQGPRKPITLKGHKGAVYDLVVADNSKYFLSLGDDRTLRVNDFVKSTIMRSFNTDYTRMALSPDNKTLVVAGPNGDVLLLNAADVDKEVVLLPKTGIPVNALAFHPSKNILAIGFDNGNVSLYQISNGGASFNKLGDDLPGHNIGISGIAFSRDGERLATASFDRTIQLWDYTNLNKLPLVFDDHDSKIWSITFTPDNKYLLAGTENGNIKVWPTEQDMISGKICDYLNRNMSDPEWIRYVAADIEYEETCGQVNLP
jgi:WD40 repeat protein